MKGYLGIYSLNSAEHENFNLVMKDAGTLSVNVPALVQAWALLFMRRAARTACAAALSCATVGSVVLRRGLRVAAGCVHHASHTKRESKS